MKGLTKKVTIFLLVLLSVVCSLGFTGCGKRKAERIDFEVMSFNIRIKTNDDKDAKNWSNRKAPLIQYLIDKDVDVICMQEVGKTQASDLTKGLDGYYHVVYCARDTSNDEGLAICYSDDFELVEQDLFWLSETPEVMSKGWGANYYRICLNLLLKHKTTGVYLDVYDVHLDHEVEEARVNGLNLVIERSTEKGYPTIVAGDFNTDNASSCYTAISEKMYDCQAEALVSDEGVTYHNWGKDVSELNKKTAIDFCFVSKDISPLEFDILEDKVSKNAYYSDHYAILSTIRVEYFPESK